MALNETLSPKQAKQINTQFEMIVNRAVKDVQTGFNDFFGEMKNEWEDHYAVELSKSLMQAMEEVTQHLQTNANAFCGTVGEIAKAYATTAGLGGVGASVLGNPKIAKLSIHSQIKENFDGDTFGFKNVDSYDKITQSVTTLVGKLKQSISEVSSQLKGINAFGNVGIMAKLAISGGKVIEILSEAVEQVEKSAKTNLQQAADAYRKTGQSAESAADIKAA